METPQSEQSPQEPVAERAGDYFVVDAYGSTWFVSLAMVRAIDAQLARRFAPRWITFVDLAGARVRLRTARIESAAQCTAAQRAAYRAFQRALDREREQERTWDDE